MVQNVFFSQLDFETIQIDLIAIFRFEWFRTSHILKPLFSTHHHGDHDGGNAPLLRLYPELKIYATDERVNAYTHMLNHLTKFSLCGLEIRTLHTPCHTTGTIIFFSNPLFMIDFRSWMFHYRLRIGPICRFRW